MQQPNFIGLPKGEFIFNDKSYYLLKRIKVDDITEYERDMYKRYYNADTILKKDGYYHYCSEVEDAKVIWEEKWLGDEVFRVDHLPEPTQERHIRYSEGVRRLTGKNRRKVRTMKSKHQRR